MNWRIVGSKRTLERLELVLSRIAKNWLVLVLETESVAMPEAKFGHLQLCNSSLELLLPQLSIL